MVLQKIILKNRVFKMIFRRTVLEFFFQKKIKNNENIIIKKLYGYYYKILF